MKLYKYYLLALLLPFVWGCRGANKSSNRSCGIDFKNVPYICPRQTGKAVFYDKNEKDFNIKEFFSKENSVYMIRFPHVFDKIKIPKNSELIFEGGFLSGDITFDNTFLSGNVRLQGSIISGSILNERFYSGWICYGDGVLDDACNINQMLSLCDTVIFQNGTYALKSLHNIYSLLEADYHSSVESHIGIYESNKHLIGNDSVYFTTIDNCMSLCIYSLPYEYDKVVSNVSIEGINFIVENNGKDFHEFVHCIKTIGVKNLKISNCKIDDYWGDGICLGHYGDNENTGERTRNSNVHIEGNTIRGKSHNNRNSISIINGKKVFVSDNVIEDVSMKKMPGAIDVEANNSAYTIDSIFILNNRISLCKGGVGAICVVCNKYNAPAYNIFIKNNKITSSNIGLAFHIDNDNCSSNFEIECNDIDFTTKSYNFVGKGRTKNWTIKNNKFSSPFSSKIGGDIQIENLIVK